jgi:hypothetical protein
MPTPNLFNAIYWLLLTSATPVALFCFVMAGLQLREEGGTNFSSNGGFFRWILWGAIFLTLTGISAWLSGEGFSGTFGASGISASYTTTLAAAFHDFAYNMLLGRIVPVIAGTLVLKSLLDTAEGRSPLPSVISALFLLGVGGFLSQAQGWNDGTTYATADLLKNMLTWAMTSVAPVLGALSIYGAIVQFVRRQNWVIYVVVGAGLLMVPALWTLIQKWVGVTAP